MSHEETATDFALGALTPGERANTAEVRLYDSALDEAIKAAEFRFATLMMRGRNAPAGERLWARINDALAEERTALSGKGVESFPDGGWRHYGPGIEAKPLWAEKTFLLRCAPCAFEPAHAQDQDEHLLVIAGDVVLGGRSFRTGDYVFIPTGARHRRMHTQRGCILLMQYAS